MPRTYEVIKKGVEVISAREEHESSFHMDSWKKQTFLNFHNNKKLCIDTDSLINMVVIGDSKYEMEAGEEFCKNSEKCIVKSVKLSEAPSSTELIKQL